MLGALTEADTNAIKTLMQNMRLLCSMDASYGLELQVLTALNGDAGTSLIQAKVLTVLPSRPPKPTPVTLETSRQRLTDMRTSAMYKYCNDAGQSSVDVVVNNLDQMILGHEPSVKALATTTFFREVLSLLLLFCYFVEKRPNSVATRTHYEGKALELTLNAADDKQKANTLDFSDLHNLHVFNWLLSDAQKNRSMH